MGCGSSSEGQNQKPAAENPNIVLKENNGEFKQDYSLKEQVGEGTYGVVRRCRHRKSGEERVVKRIHKNSLRKEELKLKLANDIIFLRKIDHPNVVKPYEFYQDDDYFWIVTELVQGGDLIQRLEDRGLLTEKEASNIVKQTLSVLSWCHGQGIMHRDLKPENIMIDSVSNKTSYQIKVIDWGTAVQTNPKQKVNDLVGTPYYIAPEVVNKSTPYNSKCDIWSLGALLYTVLSGDPPFFAEDIHQILSLVEVGDWSFEGEIWDSRQGGISEQAKDLISKMMVKDPNQRISAEEALQHEWIRNAPENQINEEQSQQFVQKLHKFNSKNKLQTAALMFITQLCSQKVERDKLSQAFRTMDKDSNGTLTKDEILDYFSQTMEKEYAQQECDAMFEKVDIDQNGVINYSEFLMATYDVQKEQQTKQLKEAFEYFDHDKNGYITAEELQKLIGGNMRDSNEELWNKIIGDADKDNDKQIDFNEFCQMMNQMANEGGQQ